MKFGSECRFPAAKIVEITAAAWQVPAQSMTSHQRGCGSHSLVRPRHMAMALIRERTGKSLPEIGRIFRRDHTTVIHAIRRHTERMRNGDLDYRALWEKCQADLDRYAQVQRLTVEVGRPMETDVKRALRKLDELEATLRLWIANCRQWRRSVLTVLSDEPPESSFGRGKGDV